MIIWKDLFDYYIKQMFKEQINHISNYIYFYIFFFKIIIPPNESWARCVASAHLVPVPSDARRNQRITILISMLDFPGESLDRSERNLAAALGSAGRAGRLP